MSRKIEIDVTSFASGVLAVAAVSSLPTVLGAAWTLVSALPSGVLGLTSMASAAALAVGAGWAVSTRRAPGCRVWSLKPGDTDFLAYQRQAFPFLPKGEAEEPPLSVEEWLLERTRHAGPWTAAEIEKALAHQLTGPFRGMALVPHCDLHRPALALLFALRIARSKDYEPVRDALARLFDRPADAAQAGAEVKALIARHMDGAGGDKIAKLIERTTERHGFSETVLMALLARARENGIVGEAEFLWLKGVDRPLFYALNALDRPSILAEGLGAACHYEAERLHGAALARPYLKPAVAGLRRAIAARREAWGERA